MTKVVVNRSYGGFGLSQWAVFRYCELKDIDPGEYDYEFCGYTNVIEQDIPRDDPALIQVVEEMGEAANCDYSNLGIVEIPDDVNWHISEYDGYEHVSEDHRTWYCTT